MRRLLPLLAALLLVPAAHAQALSVYATFSPSHLSNVQTGAVYSATQGYVNQTASYWSPGFGAGVTANLIPIGPLRIGFDLRGSEKPGNNGVSSVLAGVRVGVHLPVIKFRPYGQFSVGYLGSRSTNVSTPAGQTTGQIGGIFSNQYAAYQIMGGVDYPLIPHLDARLLEIGAGSSLTLSGTTYKPTYFTVNSGIVLHF